MNKKLLLMADAAEGNMAAANDVLEEPPAINTPPGATTQTPPAAAPTLTAAPANKTGGDAVPPAGDTKPTGLSKEEISSIVAEAMSTVMPAKPAEGATATEPQYTQEQLEEMFKFWKPDAGFLKMLGLDDKPEALKAFGMLRDALAKQIMTMSSYHIKQQLEELRTVEIVPLKDYVSAAQAERAREDFFTEHEDLRQYEEIVDAVALKLEQSGFTGTPKQTQAEIAKNAKAVIARFQAAGGGNGNTPTPPPKRSKMSTLTGGGQSGSVPAGGVKTPNRLPGMEIFDE